MTTDRPVYVDPHTANSALATVALVCTGDVDGAVQISDPITVTALILLSQGIADQLPEDTIDWQQLADAYRAMLANLEANEYAPDDSSSE